MSDQRFAVDPTARVLLADLGIAAGNVLRRAGLPADLLARGQTTLSPTEYYAFWRALEDEADDPNLPIAIGRSLSVEMFSPPIFAALCSPNLRIAAHRIARYKHLIGPLRLLVGESDGELTLTYVWPDADAPAVLTTTELVFWVALVRLATRLEVTPVRVRGTAPPREQEAYLEYLGVPVEHGAADEVTFSGIDAIRPFLTADERMWEWFEPELRRRLSELEADATMTERVRAALLESLPAGRASMDAVAQDLAMSTRTVQRRLQSEQTNFKSVLSDTREALARHYLSSADMSAAEISFLLGYEDPNSFYRAFHSWTGQTPERVRAAG